MFIKGPWFQKKYIAFFTIVPLLMASAIVEVDDPVCEGTGVISPTPGMDNVRIIRTESTERSIIRDTCGAYLVYGYDVTISAENTGPEAVAGWVKLTLIDFVRGKALNTQYIILEIDGNTTVDTTYTVWFTTGLNEKEVTEVQATLVLTDLPDPTCDGTGKIPLNTYLLVNYQKDSLLQLSQIPRPEAPPEMPFDDEG
jgi:hypothetical protein